MPSAYVSSRRYDDVEAEGVSKSERDSAKRCRGFTTSPTDNNSNHVAPSTFPVRRGRKTLLPFEDCDASGSAKRRPFVAWLLTLATAHVVYTAKPAGPIFSSLRDFRPFRAKCSSKGNVSSRNLGGRLSHLGQDRASVPDDAGRDPKDATQARGCSSRPTNVGRLYSNPSDAGLHRRPGHGDTFSDRRRTDGIRLFVTVPSAVAAAISF